MGGVWRCRYKTAKSFISRGIMIDITKRKEAEEAVIGRGMLNLQIKLSRNFWLI
jgi:hypothetical protein